MYVMNSLIPTSLTIILGSYTMKYSFLGCLLVFANIASERCLAQLPIKPARTVNFTTDEGSYMNLDLSPDGKTLLFDLLGDLYTLPATGGTATQLTRGLALNLRPVWSPDGNKIAYISDFSGAFHLNVRDIPGKYHKVLGEAEPELDYKENAVWMPDGNYVIMKGAAYSLAGGKLSLTNGIKKPVGFSTDDCAVYHIDSDTIFRFDNRVNQQQPIGGLAPGSEATGILSPDKQWWAYLKDANDNTSLVICNLNNGAEKVLIKSLLTGVYEHSVFRGRFTFSPSSEAIFISYGGKIHRIQVSNGEDKVIPFTANVKTDMGAYVYNTFRVTYDSIKVRYARSAHTSPDGRQLVFASLNQLYVMNLPAGKVHLLAPQSCSQFQPVFSPDGKWIAYVSWCDTAGGFLWRVPAQGGQPEQLTRVPGQYQRPAWSPDGKSIAVIRGEPKLKDRDNRGQGQLEILSLNDSIIRVIEQDVPLWNNLSFSKDGKRILYTPVFRSEQGSLGAILVTRDIETNRQEVMAVGENAGFFQCSLSPDERFIVYSFAEDLLLLPVCQLGQPQVLYKRNEKLPLIRFSEGVDPYWDKEGNVLNWTYGNRFYTIRSDKIVAAATKQAADSSNASNEQFPTVKVLPDRVVNLDIKASASHAKGLLALRNVRIITMQGNKIIEHGILLVKDGRIASVGKLGEVKVPAGAKVFDLPGTTVMPGLVDVHLHMRISPDIIPQQEWRFLVNLAYGVTTARDPSLSFDSYGYKELLETGQMIGPRLFTVGRSVRLTHGMIKCENLADVQAAVRKRGLLGSTVVKQYQLGPRFQKQWVLTACRQQGINMTNEGAGDPIYQLGMLKDGSTGLEHNPGWTDVYKDIITFMALSKTYITPTLQVTYGVKGGQEYFQYKYWHNPDKKLVRFMLSDSLQKGTPSNGAASLETIINAQPSDSLKPEFLRYAQIDARIRQLGGRVILGSHGNDEGIGVHNELWALQMGGISNLQALQAATILGAEALGIQRDLGSIEPDKIADLLILNKNPLDDIHNSREIRYVMKDGILYNGDTLDELWPEQKKCPEWKMPGK